MIKTEIFLTLRYLSVRKKSFFNLLTVGISVGGIALGVSALIITLAVMSGFQREIRHKILGFNPHIIMFNPSGKDTLEKLKDIPEIKEAHQFVLGQVMLQSSHNSSGVVLRGVDSGKIPSKSSPLQIHNLQTDEAFAGVELARSLGISEGETIFAIVSPPGAFGYIPKIKGLRVVQFFETGMFEYDSSVIVTKLDTARNILGLGQSEVSGIGIVLKNPDKVRSVVRKIIKQWPAAHIRSWQQLNRNLFEALRLEKIMMFIILTLIVIVAAFNIISNLMLFVSQKSKDIGILKSLGMPNAAINRIFIFIGMVLGSLGIILGTIFGLVVCAIIKKYDIIRLPADIYWISRLPVSVNVVDVISVIVASFLITVLATIWPSYKAGKMNAAEILRYG